MLMKYRLFTPGPTSVPPETLEVLGRPVHHHRTAEFRKTFTEVQTLLKEVYQTAQPVHVITGSGTAAFEAGLTSTLAPGAKILNVTNGKFAERWAQQAKTFGLELKELKLEYGKHVTPAQLEAELKAAKYDAVALVHSETSTATACDLEAVAKVVRGHGDTLLIVDGITSIGALPFKMDAWGVDVGITGSQKALMLPPGLGFVALSQRAQAKMHANPNTRNFYFDLRKSEKSMPDGDTPFTPANTLIEGLEVSLKIIKKEGIENVWKRTAVTAKAFREGMKAIGLEVFSQMPSDSVTAIKYPAGVTDKDFRNTLKNAHNIHVAGGQGSMEGTLFRVNHMGYSDAYDALAVVAGVEHTLRKLGQKVDYGAGVAAAHKVLGELF